VLDHGRDWNLSSVETPSSQKPLLNWGIDKKPGGGRRKLDGEKGRVEGRADQRGEPHSVLLRRAIARCGA